MNFRVCFLVVGVLALWSQDAVASRRVAFRPAPDWVIPVSPDDLYRMPRDAGDESAAYLCYDRQVHLGSGPPEYYFHVSEKMLAASGLQDHTQLTFTFAPSYEELAVHEVRLVRDGRSIDVLRPEKLKVIQQETDLEEQIYDERLTALVFLEDLRVGDIIEYSFTRTGMNPVMEDRFSAYPDLAFGEPVGYFRYRVESPSNRKFSCSTHGDWPAPSIRTEAGVTTHLWERRDVPAVLADDDLPDWFTPYPWAEISEFASWSEVRSWAVRQYETDMRDSSELDRLAARLQAGRSADAAVLEAVRFVQDEIRYLGLEIGSNSHRPHPPQEVLSQRFGDCKDKSLLLITLLRRLGVKAWPVLVNTDYDKVLGEWLPSPQAFDHVIVEIESSAGRLWVDPTLALQGGKLTDSAAAARYEHGLVVRPETAALTASPGNPDAGLKHIEETYEADGKDGNAGRLIVRSVYTGLAADQMRRSLADTSTKELAKEYLNYYAKKHKGIQMDADPVSRDDRATNRLEVTEKYRIPGYWGADEHEFFAWAIDAEIPNPKTRVRSMPFAVSHPDRVRYTLHVPSSAAPGLPGEQVIDSPVFRLVRRYSSRVDVATIDYEYQSKKDFVEMKDFEAALGDFEKARDALESYSSPHRGTDPGRGEALLWGFVVIGCGVGAFFTVRIAQRTVRKLRWKRGAAVRPGEAPATALEADSPEAIEALLRARRCPCGALGAVAQRDYFRARYLDRMMTVTTQRCSCGRESTLYFLVAPPKTPLESQAIPLPRP